MNKTKIRRARRSSTKRQENVSCIVSDIEEVSSDDDTPDRAPRRVSARVLKYTAEQQARDALDPFDQFKCFAVAIRLEQINNHFTKHIVSINRELDIIYANAHILRGVNTGLSSNITIIDVRINSDMYFLIKDLQNETLCVNTPNGGLHLYYKYDDRLNSIYDTLEGVSVLNDNRFVFAGSNTYQVQNKFTPVATMPQTVFNVLYEAQQKPQNIYTRAVEAFAGLEDDWFLEEHHFVKLVHVLRNANATDKMCINTLKYVLVSRFGWYDRYKITELIK